MLRGQCRGPRLPSTMYMRWTSRNLSAKESLPVLLRQVSVSEKYGNKEWKEGTERIGELPAA